MKEKIKNVMVDILTERGELTLTALENYESFRKLCLGVRLSNCKFNDQIQNITLDS